MHAARSLVNQAEIVSTFHYSWGGKRLPACKLAKKKKHKANLVQTQQDIIIIQLERNKSLTETVTPATNIYIFCVSSCLTPPQNKSISLQQDQTGIMCRAPQAATFKKKKKNPRKNRKLNK